MQFYTYLHCRSDGTPFYVGKGCFGKGHSKRSHDLKHGRNIFHNRVVEKIGAQNVLIFVFYCDSEDDAFSDEIQQIAQLRREGYLLTNMTDGGEGVSGMIISAEHRKKISAALKGRQCAPFTVEHRAKLSAARKGISIPHSAESKAKISAALTGKTRESPSDDTRRKMSLAHTGTIRSEEAKLKSSIAMKGRKRPDISIRQTGMRHSPETRARMSIAAKRRFVLPILVKIEDIFCKESENQDALRVAYDAIKGKVSPLIAEMRALFDQ